MKVLSEESVRECFNFTTEYYAIRHEVKTAVAISINDREWQRIFTWIFAWTSKLQE